MIQPRHLRQSGCGNMHGNRLQRCNASHDRANNRQQAMNGTLVRTQGAPRPICY
ncbi:MAG: hypothetical protein LBS09_01270 [Bacteroidales bacterium]|nr:hypothetical protein [Bacteroidales bacterium]